MTRTGQPSTDHPLVVFSHGNGFPGGTYSTLLRSLRPRGYHIQVVDRFGHDPRYPVTSNWPHLVQQLADFVTQEAAGHSGPLLLVGHSMGGFLSLMCAARFPELAGHRVRGVVLLDSPLLGGWRAKALQAVKQSRLIGSLSPGQVSRKRRNTWPDVDAVLEHFRHKRAFAHWDPQALLDYVEHGTQEVAAPDGQTRRVLRFDREVETQVYNTLPHNLDRLLRRHPLQCPVAFVGGTASVEMKQVGMTMTHRLVGRMPSARLQMVEGSHLFPMERPHDTATAVDAALRDLLAHTA